MSRTSISKILAPIDGSETSMRAAKVAIEIASRYQASVVVVHVMNMDQYLQAFGLYRLSYPESVKTRLEKAKKEAHRWFDKIKELAQHKMVEVRTTIIDTPLSIVGEIVNIAEIEKSDLIVIGTRGRTGFARLLLGSVASGVVTYASCPVLVVK